MEKYTATINNWFVMGDCIWGNVTEHSVRKFDPDNLQRTSTLISIDEEAGVAETINTSYTLGTKSNKAVL